MPDSNLVGMKRSSCYLPSIYGDSQGGSSSSDKDACIAKTSEKQDLGKDYCFNNLTPLFLKSTFQRNAVLAQEKEIKVHDQSVVIDSSKESHGLSERFEGQKPLISDNHSEAVGCNRRGFGMKRKSDNSWSDDEVTLMESSSVCSLEASNNTDDSSYSSDDNDEEPEDIMKEKPSWAGTRVKRRRNPETHSFNERKQRDKINKKMRILKELIPNCNKMDKASMLDDAIEYLKTLKLQLQIMSMGAGLCMPLTMLPHQMINTPHLPQLMGFSFRPGSTNIPFTVPQFPMTPLSGITDNRVGMFGFPNQMPTMPFSHAPFIPMFGIENPSTQPHLPTSTASNMVENLASSQLTTQQASVTNNSYLNGQAQCEAKQALNHVSFHH